MNHNIFKYLTKCGNVHENKAELNFFQADFIDKGVTNLAGTGTCKVIMHAANQLG